MTAISQAPRSVSTRAPAREASAVVALQLEDEPAPIAAPRIEGQARMWSWIGVSAISALLIGVGIGRASGSAWSDAPEAHVQHAARVHAERDRSAVGRTSPMPNAEARTSMAALRAAAPDLVRDRPSARPASARKSAALPTRRAELPPAPRSAGDPNAVADAKAALELLDAPNTQVAPRGEHEAHAAAAEPIVVPATRLSGPKVSYPPAARARRIEGFVLVRFTISAKGTVEDARVEESVPPGVFDNTALDAIRFTIYQPRTENGVPVMTQGALKRFRFELPNGAGPRR